ncbi:exonuclease [Nitzschia inconspicua]|uniref:Exonuclease n=1 Tax=Nitzschia inconspicua TaxID=303405 RepID=A0A9K3M1I7_9STRA|nr:exonuclease [Nitzschia inconspicua]
MDGQVVVANAATLEDVATKTDPAMTVDLNQEYAILDGKWGGDDNVKELQLKIGGISSSKDNESSSKDQQKQSRKQKKVPKCDRKRLKKLRKRVQIVNREHERSGLLTPVDVNEYKRLVELDKISSEDSKESVGDDPVALGPSIHLRSKKKTVKTAEGAHHRDLLLWFLQLIGGTADGTCNTSNNKFKKRTRDEPVKATIPHWACVHNPGAVEQIAIVEVHVAASSGDTAMPSPLQRYIQFLDACIAPKMNDHATTSTQQSSCSRSSIGLSTKWFQGDRVRSMTHSLLNFSGHQTGMSVSEQRESIVVKKQKNVESTPPTLSELLDGLERLLLTRDQMFRLGYPQVLIEEDTSNGVQKREEDGLPDFGGALVHPDSIPLNQAKEYVQNFGVRVGKKDGGEYSQLYVQTGCVDASVDSVPRVFGLDCEMVLTKNGQELARVTMVQFEEFVLSSVKKTAPSKVKVLLDCLVRPESWVVDYATRFSGITAKILAPIHTHLAQVQCALAKFLRPNDILVGHSLENDLRALHLVHHRVVDTAIVFQAANKRTKFSLRHLSAYILNRNIQTGSHCSEEDAQATLDLALQKAYLGDQLKAPGGDQDENYTLLEYCPKTKEGSPSSVFIGSSTWLKDNITPYANTAHALSYDSVDDCKKAMLSWMTGQRKSQLVWTNVVLPNGNESFEVFQSLIENILEKLPQPCILVIAMQYGLDGARVASGQRKVCQDVRSSVGWSKEKEKVYQKELDRTRWGHVHWFGA